MTPAEKRNETIKRKYGSHRQMLAQTRDVQDQILGGYNGGIRQVQKGFAKWEEGKLAEFANSRQRDSKGRFVKKAKLPPPIKGGSAG